jgi:hypothetical protein
VVPVAMQRSLPALMNCSSAGAPPSGGLQAPGHQVGQHRAGAAVGHVHHEDVSVAIFRYSKARWPALPLPAEP